MAFQANLLEKPTHATQHLLTTNYHYNADVTNLETDNKGINLYNTSKYFIFILMLIECKTLYDSRANSHNIPQHRAIQYAPPEKQAKEPCKYLLAECSNMLSLLTGSLSNMIKNADSLALQFGKKL